MDFLNRYIQFKGEIPTPLKPQKQNYKINDETLNRYEKLRIPLKSVFFQDMKLKKKDKLKTNIVNDPNNIEKMTIELGEVKHEKISQYNIKKSDLRGGLKIYERPLFYLAIVGTIGGIILLKN